jgi:hypothetical protein
LGCGVLAPVILQWVVRISLSQYALLPNLIHSVYSFALGQLLLALYFGIKLRWRLERRAFPLERTVF